MVIPVPLRDCNDVRSFRRTYRSGRPLTALLIARLRTRPTRCSAQSGSRGRYIAHRASCLSAERWCESPSSAHRHRDAQAFQDALAARSSRSPSWCRRRPRPCRQSGREFQYSAGRRWRSRRSNWRLRSGCVPVEVDGAVKRDLLHLLGHAGVQDRLPCILQHLGYVHKLPPPFVCSAQNHVTRTSRAVTTTRRWGNQAGIDAPNITTGVSPATLAQQQQNGRRATARRGRHKGPPSGSNARVTALRW